jgi:plastocyanin
MPGMGHRGRAKRVRRGLSVAAATVVAVALPAAFAPAANAETLKAVKGYQGQTTFQCRTDAIPIHPGQNLNDFTVTKTCPNAVKVSGPLSTDVFTEGAANKGFITRFKPSMVEILPNGETTTPSVWDLHLHHVVWLSGGGPTFASGEEKTIVKLPTDYGFPVRGDANWGLNQMLHSLNASEGRQVYITWEIDWVPETTNLKPVRIQWMDVAGSPQIYPVFDAEKDFDLNGDNRYVFPDEVPKDPAMPGYEERSKISPSMRWVVPNNGGTLVFGAGHLHPGGKRVDLKVSRDGPDAGTSAGDTPSEVRQLFRSDAKYYEPAGAVSWDVSMEATPRNWRVSVKEGDVVQINTTYNVKRGSWYESMGILPIAWSKSPDPAARDPFDDSEEVQAMYETGGILTHGRLKENIDYKARKDLKLPDPRKLNSAGLVPAGGIDIDSFVYSPGGYSATRNFPTNLMRPPVVDPGDTVQFTNNDALPGVPQTEQVWHSITSCKAPCNKGSGIGYPLANGPISFDSGQLGFGTGTSAEVTTGTSTYETPPLKKAGETYTYFCRIHPFMRGSVRTAKK